MVPDLGGVIKHPAFGIRHQKLEGFVCPLMVAFQLLAEFVVVTAVMLAVVVLEGLLGEVWLQSISRVWEDWF